MDNHWIGNKHKIISRLSHDIPLAMVLFAVCSFFGFHHLAVSGKERSIIALEPYVFQAAIPLTAGQGLYEPDPDQTPEITAFFNGEIESINLSDLSKSIPENDIASAGEYHVYLNYTVAFLWRLFGISRRTLEPLAVFMFAWTALAVYGLLRCGMRKSIASLCTLALMFSPAMIYEFPYIRDFSKAPFLFTMAFMLAFSVKQRLHGFCLLLFVGLLGLIHGVALGFRQDALIFLPLILCLLVIISYRGALYRRTVSTHKYLKKGASVLGALLVYLTAFLIVAWPMLGKMEGGADPYHPLIMGCSMKHMRNLGIRPNMYEILASGQDHYAFNAYYHHYNRNSDAPKEHFGWDTPGSAKAAKEMFIDYIVHFPGDMLTRVYASCFRALRYADAYTNLQFNKSHPVYEMLSNSHLALSRHLHRFGLLYAYLSLLILSGRNLYLAFMLFFIGLYSCGYAALESELRHTFHLSLMPFLILGFLLETLCGVIAGVWVWIATYKNRPADARDRLYFHGKTFLIRGSLFTIGALVIILVSLQALRVYQQHTAGKVIKPYLEAERVPRTYTKTNRFGWTIFYIQTPPDETKAYKNDVSALCEIIADVLQLEFPCLLPARYVVAEFDGGQIPEKILINYQHGNIWNNFYQLVQLPKIEKTSGRVYHGIPVYEMFSVVSRSCFTGIAIPDSYAGAFRGFSEISDPSNFRFLMHLTWAEKDTLERPFFMKNSKKLPLYQRLDYFPDPLYYDVVPHSTLAFQQLAEIATKMNRRQEAVLYYGLRLLFPIDPMLLLFNAQKLYSLDALDIALKATGLLVKQSEVDRPPLELLVRDIACKSLTNCFAGDARKNAQLAFEQLMTNPSENAVMPALDIIEKQIQCGLYADVTRNLTSLVLAFPERGETAQYINNFLASRESRQDKTSFWRSVATARPQTCLPWIQLGDALGQQNAWQEAVAAYRTALRNAPSSEMAASRLENAARNIEKEEPPVLP